MMSFMNASRGARRKATTISALLFLIVLAQTVLVARNVRYSSSTNRLKSEGGGGEDRALASSSQQSDSDLAFNNPGGGGGGGGGGDVIEAIIDTSSSPSTTKNSRHFSYLFPEGELNVEPILPRKCVSLRFRGDDNIYSLEDAITLLQSKYKSHNPATPSGTTKPTLQLGIMIMEDIQTFFPVRIRETGNYYHLYHFMEILVMAYASLHKIVAALPSINNDNNNLRKTTLSRGNPAVAVPWIFSPYMTPSEICGGPGQLNCVAADLTLQAMSYSVFQNKTAIVGLEPMETYPYNFTDHKQKAVDRRLDLVHGDSPYYSQSSSLSDFANLADGVLTIERFGCDMSQINKPWSQFIDSFPAEQWHTDIQTALGTNTGRNEQQPANKLVVGYIDRQNTDRHLPPEHHNWLVEYLSSHPHVDFHQLHMENYTAIEQVRAAHKCHVLIGMHGNGLTHSLWMRPSGYVIEFFWKYNYQYDYATAAQMLNHTYLGLMNGRVLDRDMVARRDVALRRHPTRKEAQQEPEQDCMRHFEEQGKPAIRDLIETAIRNVL